MGFWKDNKQNGLGKFIHNGKIRYGLWENGNLKDKIKEEVNFIKQLNREEVKYLNFFKYNTYNEVLQKIRNILSL